MKKYLIERINEMKRLIKLYEQIARESNGAYSYEEAIKQVFFYKGGLEELEAFSEEFDFE